MYQDMSFNTKYDSKLSDDVYLRQGIRQGTFFINNTTPFSTTFEKDTSEILPGKYSLTYLC